MDIQTIISKNINDYLSPSFPIWKIKLVKSQITTGKIKTNVEHRICEEIDTIYMFTKEKISKSHDDYLENPWHFLYNRDGVFKRGTHPERWWKDELIPEYYILSDKEVLIPSTKRISQTEITSDVINEYKLKNFCKIDSYDNIVYNVVDCKRLA